MSIEFTDNSIRVEAAIVEAAIAYLHEAVGELEAQVKRNTRVDTGQTKGEWQHVVNESNLEAIVGNTLENAIWEEFGTGEYALNGDGRKGGWHYIDSKGIGHFTKGKTPTRAFQKAFTSLKAALIERAEAVLKAGLRE